MKLSQKRWCVSQSLNTPFNSLLHFFQLRDLCVLRGELSSRLAIKGQPRCVVVNPAFGFTLVELIAVVVILGMLASVTGLSIRSYMISAKQHTAKMELSKIRQAMETFATVHDRYPTTEEGINILAKGTDKFPKQLEKLPHDPWGHDYIYLIPGTNVDYEVLCYGADGREGGTGADSDISTAQFESSTNAQ